MAWPPSGGSGGGGSGTMQEAYDASVDPQITTTTALGPVALKRGSAADTDAVLQVLNGAGTETFEVHGDGQIHGKELVISKDPARGIKLEHASPTFGWRDLKGEILVRATGPTAPSFVAFRGGGCRAYAFDVGDECDLKFHMPHDYAPNTDIYLHVHWLHNGTAIGGNLILDYCVTYAKGHNQEAFGVEITPQQTIATPDVATVPRWNHRIEEFLLSTPGGGLALLDSADLEVDGILAVNVSPSTIPSIGGGSPNEPFILYADIHYQSTGIPTKNKAPPFYV